MKPVKIQIAKNMGWDKPTKMIDWEGFPTTIPGLYLARPLGPDELPEPKGWNIIHKSGWYINPSILKSEKKAKEFIKALDSKALNWDLSLEELKADYSRPFSEYSKAVREVWVERFGKMEIEQIKDYLERHDYYCDYEGKVNHPSNESRQVYGCHLFAKSKEILEEMIPWYQRTGWQAWIVGTMDNVPAAYLYKEIE